MRRPTAAADMDALDRLAPEVREAVNDSPFCLSPALLAADIRRCGMDTAAALRFVANLERSAREDVATAERVAGRNEMRRRGRA